jgi:hypothetical protein
VRTKKLDSYAIFVFIVVAGRRNTKALQKCVQREGMCVEMRSDYDENEIKLGEDESMSLIGVVSDAPIFPKLNFHNTHPKHTHP